jgi:uncharacterized repeat protein (TIGR01451 family)
MTERERPSQTIRNQSMVRFSTGRYTGVSYSNIVSTDLVGPAITLLKSASERLACLGSDVVYTVIAANRGNRPADVVLFDRLSESVSFVRGSVRVDGHPRPDAEPARGIAVGTLRPNEQAIVAFQATVTGEPPGRKIENQAVARYTFVSADGSRTEREARSNALTIEVATPPVPSIAIEHTVSPDMVAPCGTVTHRVALRNDGPLPADATLTGIRVRGLQPVPESFRLNGDPLRPSSAGDRVPLGRLEPGETMTVEFDSRVDCDWTASRIRGRIAAECSFTHGECRIKQTYSAPPYRLVIIEDEE